MLSARRKSETRLVGRSMPFALLCITSREPAALAAGRGYRLGNVPRQAIDTPGGVNAIHKEDEHSYEEQ